MAEQRNGFVCRRDDGPELVGHAGTFIQWNTHTACENYCKPERPEQIMRSVTYIGPDAPQWRHRPTCAGKWLGDLNLAFCLLPHHIERWDEYKVFCGNGPWFGPIPECPKEVTT